MAIARRRSLAFPTPPAPSPTLPPGGLPAPGSGATPLPQVDQPAPDGSTAPVGRLRRCTFRRVDKVKAAPQRADVPTYEVMCLYVDREEPLALGSIDEARPVCAGCKATGIFRPDED